MSGVRTLRVRKMPSARKIWYDLCNSSGMDGAWKIKRKSKSTNLTGQKTFKLGGKWGECVKEGKQSNSNYKVENRNAAQKQGDCCVWLESCFSGYCLTGLCLICSVSRKGVLDG